MTPDSHSVTQGIGRLARLFNTQRRSEFLLQTFSCVKKFSRLVPQSNSRDRQRRHERDTTRRRMSDSGRSSQTTLCSRPQQRRRVKFI